MERQKHGFDYQADVIERFALVKDENYTGKWDAYCDGIPVSIKNPKIGSDIELAVFFRQSNINEDFYMIVGFHDREDKSSIIEEYVLYIPKEKWVALFNPSFNARFKDLLDNCSNERAYDSIWTEKVTLLKADWKRNTSNLIRPRFKRDHKTQKRIQCAINNKDFYNYFIPQYVVGVV